MRYFFMDTKFIGLKVILISFLIHMFFFNFFVFTFRVRPTQPGPLFVFLGSILQKQNLLNMASDHTRPNIIPQDLQLQTPVEGHRFTSIKKPPFPTARTRQKILCKPPFDNTPSPSSTFDQNKKELKRNNEMTPYQPLKMYDVQ